MLYFMFDRGDLISRVPRWEWGDASRWRQVCTGPILMRVILTYFAGPPHVWEDRRQGNDRQRHLKDAQRFSRGNVYQQ